MGAMLAPHGIGRRLRRCLALASTIALAASLASSAIARDVPGQGRWVRFSDDSGLVGGDVRGVRLARDGTPWAVTRSELFHYDGFRWTPVPLPEPDTWLWTVELAPLGDAAMLVNLGHGLLVAHGGTVRKLAVRAGDVAVQVHAAVGTPGGEIVARIFDPGTRRRHVGWIDPGTGAFRALPDPDRGRFDWESGLWVGPDGSVYTNVDRDLLRFRDGDWTRVFDGGPANVAFLACGDAGRCVASLGLPDDRAGIWMWDGQGAPARSDDVGASAVLRGTALASGEVVALFDDGGIREFDGARWGEPLGLPLAVRWIHDVAAGPGGDVWVASDAGLFVDRRADRPWRRWHRREHGNANRVHDLAIDDDGRLWTATADGLVVWTPDGRPERIRPDPTRETDAIIAVALDPDGTVWASAPLGASGVRRRIGGRWIHYDVDDGFDAGAVHRIAIDPDGTAWFLTLPAVDDDGRPLGGGVVRYRDGAFDRPVSKAGAREPDRVYEMAVAPDGARWFATSDGLCRLVGSDWRCIGRAEGLRIDRVFALDVDRDGTVWFSHDDFGVGVLRDGVIDYQRRLDDLLFRDVRDITVDDRGWVWMSIRGGVVLVRDGVVLPLTVEDGLPSATQWPVLVTDDRVYLGSNARGVAVLQLDRLDPTPPRVVIDEPRPGREDVHVSWSAFAHRGSMPPASIRTRYRIDGGPWSSWSRSRSVDLRGLAAGLHTVEVAALGVLGRPSEPAAASFSWTPPSYARAHLVGLIGVLVGGIGVLVVLLVVRARAHGRALRDSEARHRRLFEMAPEPIWVLDGGARVAAVNPATEQLLGRSRQDLAGVPFESLLAETSRPPFRGALGEAREAGGRPVAREIEIEVEREGTEPVVLECSARALDPAPHGPGSVLFFARDVTARRSLEARLHEAQKLEAIGRLAGGIAHDFGNLMMAVTVYSHWLLRRIPAGDPGHEDVRRILRAGERATWLTRQLSEFSRRRARTPEPLALVQVVKDLAPIVRTSVSESIGLEFDLDARVGRIVADAGQIQVLLLNLVANARDAAGPGGHVRVAVRDAWIDAADAARHGLETAGWFVVFEVADDGVGMDESTRARMFEPFFTTKPHGEGTGLGLASVYGIVRQNGWGLDVRSRPGEGATIRVLIPHAEEEVRVGEDGAEPAAEAQPLTVLVVEDSEEIVSLLRSVLEDRGYRVLVATDGRSAVERFRKYAHPVDVLLTDVVLPGIGGPELARTLRRRRPELRVVYMSGYPDELRPDGPGPDPGDRLLRKPFSVRELFRILEADADEAQPSPSSERT